MRQWRMPGRIAEVARRRRNGDLDNIAPDSDSYRAQYGRRLIGLALPGEPRKKLVFRTFQTACGPSRACGTAPVPDCLHL